MTEKSKKEVLAELERILSDVTVYSIGWNLTQGKIIIDILEYERNG